MNNRWATIIEEKHGTMPHAELLVQAQKLALANGHTFTKHDGQPFAELLDLEDEVAELAQALRNGEGLRAMHNEMGDVIFSLLNICRASGIDFNAALETFTSRWLARKTLQEQLIFDAGYTWANVPHEVNERIWQQVKAQLKQQEMAA